MNIKRAKEEIRNTIEAYLLKNEYGEYEIPVMAQRPVFLLAHLESARHRSWSRFPGNVRWDWFLTPLPTIPDRVQLDFLLFPERILTEKRWQLQNIP